MEPSGTNNNTAKSDGCSAESVGRPAEILYFSAGNSGRPAEIFDFSAGNSGQPAETLDSSAGNPDNQRKL
jgi:hypothetical protein